VKVVFREVLHPIELELNVFDERGKPENAEKKLLEQSKEPTTNLTLLWCVFKFNSIWKRHNKHQTNLIFSILAVIYNTLFFSLQFITLVLCTWAIN